MNFTFTEDDILGQIWLLHLRRMTNRVVYGCYIFGRWKNISVMDAKWTGIAERVRF